VHLNPIASIVVEILCIYMFFWFQKPKQAANVVICVYNIRAISGASRWS